MIIITTLFFVLGLFALLFTGLGLCFPKSVIKWGVKRGRKQVLIYYGLTTLVFSLLFCIAAIIEYVPQDDKGINSTITETTDSIETQALATEQIHVNDYFPLEEERSYIYKIVETEKNQISYEWVKYEGKKTIDGRSVYALSRYSYESDSDFKSYFLFGDTTRLYMLYTYDKENNLLKVGSGSLSKIKYNDTDTITYSNLVLRSDFVSGKEYMFDQDILDECKIIFKKLDSIILPNGKRFDDILMVERHQVINSYNKSTSTEITTYEYYAKNHGLIKKNFQHTFQELNNGQVIREEKVGEEMYLEKIGIPDKFTELTETVEDYNHLKVNYEAMVEYFKSMGCQFNNPGVNPRLEEFISFSDNDKKVGGNITKKGSGIKSIRVYMPVFINVSDLAVSSEFGKATEAIFDQEYAGKIISWISDPDTYNEAYNMGYNHQTATTVELVKTIGEYQITLHYYQINGYIGASFGVETH